MTCPPPQLFSSSPFFDGSRLLPALRRQVRSRLVPPSDLDSFLSRRGIRYWTCTSDNFEVFLWPLVLNGLLFPENLRGAPVFSDTFYFF